MENLPQGFAILVMGLAITFAALAIFIGVITLLNRFFPPGQESEEEVEEREFVGSLERDTTDEEIAAAIVIALSQLYSYEICRSDLGISLETGHSQWWITGRRDQRPLGTLALRGRN
jgi:Na+-transporting methylmalonyl-CoA/oxaloacetate decarboxylase gamma subunit